MGLQIHYDTKSFMWDDIKVKMVPQKHWDYTTIKIFWQNRKTIAEESQLTEIKPDDYRTAEIQEIINQQVHLLPSEHTKLLNTLLEFSPLFQGTQGNYKSDPIELELLPGSKHFLVNHIQFQKHT
jgi:hypothetical protein